jgi:phosphoadenosine phosphosulfate reductase
MSAPKKSVVVTMVKKRLSSGEACKKCIQAEEMLRRRGLWDAVDEVLWADESNPQSRGMLLAVEHHIETAPFFLVEREEGTVVYPSVIKVAKDVLAEKAEAEAQTYTSYRPIPLGREFFLAEAERLSSVAPEEAIRSVLKSFGAKCAIAFSGAEDVVLIDMAAKLGLNYSVFSLDTGRLHPQTYRFMDTVRQFYGVEVQILYPNCVEVEGLVRRKGLFSFYEDGHGECCGVRKLEPLRRALSGFDAWITGQRRDQSPTRADVPVLDWDESHRSAGMLKLNPLAHMTQAEVWAYIRENDVPYNELHDQGFLSIGCEPCTRAIRPGEHERAARWWWEGATKRECGLHS